MNDVFDDVIDSKILNFFQENLKRTTGKSEKDSWRESYQYMERVLKDDLIPDSCGVAIEYQLPQSGKRIDFILTGLGENGEEYCLIVELKRWSEATLSNKDAIVYTRVGKHFGEFPHPSYQAWSYASLLYNFNETITKDKIDLKPCAYLHNYVPDEVMKNEHYKEHLDKAPVFLKGEAAKLRTFIKQYIRYGDSKKILYRIENSKIKPSKMLADSVASMIKGNSEFVMIDEQKLVYEAALALSQKANPKRKKILIVKGGPGTGKSVVAINLLVELTKRGFLAQYVSKNAAPRSVYESKLTGTIKKTEISNLFRGSGGFVNTGANTFTTLIVDEAHRLNARSGLYGNLGDNQIKEIIYAAPCSIFFIDEDQRVTLKDIGTLHEIRKWANKADADVEEMELSSQFRCNGSDGYLAWLDNTIQIRETANTTLDGINYDFQVFDSPVTLREAIIKKNKVSNKARMVAGYCWKWLSKKNSRLHDVIIPEFDFRMTWNLTTDGSLWIISPDSVNEIGCIHTCQGLEVDYIGVIVGHDLIVRNGKILTNPSARATSDKSISGYKRLLEKNPKEAKGIIDSIIKNTYRTLMTRGMKGCYVYFMDKETGDFFKSVIK